MRKLEPTSTLFLLLFFCYEQHGLMVTGLHPHHQTNICMKLSPSCLSPSSSGVLRSRSSQRLGGNSVDYNYSSQDKEESAVDEFGFDVFQDREGTGSVKVSVTTILVV